MEEAKEVHKCLKIAAGVFTYVKVSLKVGHQSSSRLHYDKWKLLEQCMHITSLDFIVQLSTTIYFHLQPAES